MKFSDIIQTITSRKIGLRIGALGLAIILWMFIVSGERYEMVMAIPLEVRNLNEQKALREEVPEMAQVRLVGAEECCLKHYY